MMLSPYISDAKALYPAPLKKGDTIAIVAPASYPEEDEATIMRAASQLTQRGYRVKLAPNLQFRHGYLAGTDDERAKAFMAAWLDPEVDALWCYRGGFGCTRILDKLDYKALEAHPKILIGMSDITALHAAINKNCSLVTFLGPNVNGVFTKSADGDSLFGERELWKLLSSNHQHPGKSYELPSPTSFPYKELTPRTIRPGVAIGRLTGGTLSLVAALIGTPWEIDTRGKILILEEVGEEPYRIDRWMRQLEQSGAFKQPAAVVLCSWRGCHGKAGKKTLSLEELFADYFSKVRYPVLYGFPSGHITDQVTLPLNSFAELDATKKQLRLIHSQDISKNTR